MKNNSYLITIIVISILLNFTSCSKKNENLDEYPYHCTNGQWDQDLGELFYDCGGPCSPCQAVTPNCSTVDNQFLIGTNQKTANLGTIQVNSSNKFTMSGSIVGGGNYEIIFGSAEPVNYRTYTINDNVNLNNLGAFEAIVKIEPSGMNLYPCESGSVFFNKIGNQYFATICEGSVWSGGLFTTQNYTIKGKVICE